MIVPPIYRYDSLHRLEILRIYLRILLRSCSLLLQFLSQTGKHPHPFYSVVFLSFTSTLIHIDCALQYSSLQGNIYDNDYISLSLTVDEYFTGFI